MQKGTIIICLLGPPEGDDDITGTTADVCSRCERVIRIAPTGREWALTAPPPVELVCAPCGVEIMRDAPGMIMPPTAAQLDEIAVHREHHTKEGP